MGREHMGLYWDDRMACHGIRAHHSPDVLGGQRDRAPATISAICAKSRNRKRPASPVPGYRPVFTIMAPSTYVGNIIESTMWQQHVLMLAETIRNTLYAALCPIPRGCQGSQRWTRWRHGLLRRASMKNDGPRIYR